MDSADDVKLTTDDFDLICRICINRPNSKKNILSERTAEMVHEILGLEVKRDDGLPTNICSTCYKRLLRFKEFQSQAKNSDFFLRCMISKAQGSHHKRERPKKKVKSTSPTSPVPQKLPENEAEENILFKRMREEQIFMLVVEEEPSTVQPLCKSEEICLPTCDTITEEEDPNKATLDHCYTKGDGPPQGVEDIFNDDGVDNVNTKESCKFDFTNGYALADDPLHKVYRVMLENTICDECDVELFSLKALSKHYYDDHDTIFVLADTMLLTCPICVCKWHLSQKKQFIQHLCDYKPYGYYFVKVNKNGKALKPKKNEVVAFTPFHLIQDLLNGVPIVDEYLLSEDTDDEVEFFKPFKNGVPKKGERKKGQALITNLKTTFFCDICGRGCGGKANLNRHYASHAKDDPKKPKLLECAICSKVFNSKLYLKEHLIQHNNEKLTGTKCIFACGMCGRKFNSKAKCLAHKNVHKNYPKTCNVCYQTFYTEVNYKKHLSEHITVENYPCYTCKETFRSLKVLHEHMTLHKTDSTMTYDCEVCGISFLSETVLHQHKQKTGHDVIQLECFHCNEYFENVIDYARHMRSTTEHPEPSECGLCGKVFKTNSLLTKHIDSHLQSCELLCSTCGAKFAELSLFLEHKAKHKQKDIEEKS